MANTFTSLHCHVIFSTKNREPWLCSDIEERVWSYLGGIARENGMKAIMIGGIDNHVHLLLGIPPTLAVSKAVQLIKGGSSAWIKETFPGLRGFGWQDGYGAFTVSKSQLPATIAYVERQRARHQTWSYQKEYRTLLERHGIQFDERYLLD